MSAELPKNWVPCEMGDVAKVVGGGTPPSKDKSNFTTEGGIPWITPADLSGYRKMYIGRGARNLTAKGFSACSAMLLPAGSVLFSSRAPVGYVAIAANELSTNQGFKSFIVPDALDSRFVYFYMRHIKSIAEERATGTTFKELSGSKAARLPLLIAPLNEQRRIADKLDTLLTRVDACRERLERVPIILKRFRQSVLDAAMSGELTEDRPRNNEGWRTLQLGSVLMDIRYGTAQKSHYNIKDGTPVIRIPNIGDGLIDPSDLKFGVFSKKELDTLSLKAGDLLLIRSNGSLELVGKVALVEPKFEGYLYAGYLIRLRVNTSIVVPQFLRFFLSSSAIRRYIELTARSTSGVNNINTEEIRSIQLHLPSIEEQHGIVRRIEALFAYAARLEVRYKSVRTRVEQLTPALLAKAFRGELVPQDPKDEPASVLLERIRASRATADGVEEITRTKRRTNLVKKPKARIIMLKRKDVEPSHLSAILKADGPLSAEALWSASQLDIDDFYDQLKDEEARGLLKENVGEQRLLEAA